MDKPAAVPESTAIASRMIADKLWPDGGPTQREIAVQTWAKCDSGTFARAAIEVICELLAKPAASPVAPQERAKVCTCPERMYFGSEVNDSTCQLTEEEHAKLASPVAGVSDINFWAVVVDGRRIWCGFNEDECESVAQSRGGTVVPYVAEPSAEGDGWIAVQAENERLKSYLNTPETNDFFAGIEAEAAHQRFRWPSENDAGKTPADWFWLVGYLAGKCLASHIAGNTEKALHHTISTAAALANWHRAIKGAGNMRPGTETPSEALPAAPVAKEGRES